MDTAITPYAPRRRPGRPVGFTLTELLVVIGIIVLLVGLLLVALGTVRDRAKVAVTETTLRAFSQACETFQMEQRYYPGYIPEAVIADESDKWMTTTENAILNLMGGCRVLSPADAAANGEVSEQYVNYTSTGQLSWGGGNNQWQMKVDLNRIGEGPLINLAPYAPYYTASSKDFGIAKGQVLPDPGSNASVQLPDLLDAWGQPILYVRQLRSIGQLVGPADDSNAPPQFALDGLEGYVNSQGLGDRGANQLYDANDNLAGSILSEGLADDVRYENFRAMISHPSIAGQARGAFALFSAGPDGVYFSASDGPGVTDLGSMTPAAAVEAVKDYDDIRVFGGG